MPTTELSVTIETRDGVAIIHVAGAVDHVQYYKLEEAIQTQLDRRQTNLVVNLSGLTYITSAGINALGHAVAQFERIRGRLFLVRPGKYAHWHFFETIGVDRIFPWVSTLEEALRQVSTAGPAAPPR